MIDINTISISYDTQIVLSNFSLSVRQGQKIALSGDSGSGKTSVFQSLLGFRTTQQGSILIDGQELTDKTAWHLRSLIGYVAQEPDLGEGTVQQIMERPFSYKANHGLANNIEKIPTRLKEFGLSDSILSKNTTSLSGGEKQRIALITALLLERPILLLDEISSALDPRSRQAVIDYLSQSDQTVLLISHDPALRMICDETVYLGNSGGGAE